MSNIWNILYTLIFGLKKYNIVILVVSLVICLVLYILCDSEKERGWLLVGAVIVLSALFYISRLTDADLQAIRTILKIE